MKTTPRPSGEREIPKPGSDEARTEGCFCARMDNGYGRGRFGDGSKYGWYVTEGCPVHAPIVVAPDLARPAGEEHDHAK